MHLPEILDLRHYDLVSTFCVVFFTQTETFPSRTDAEKLQNEPESNEMKCPI